MFTTKMQSPGLPPPTYESAVSRDIWVLVAPHLLSSGSRIGDLHAACLVSRRWHEIFIPYLWGDPASHFEGEQEGERDLCDAISRFRRIVKIARLSVRKQTHTLRLPPARSEIYGGPKHTWLRDLLEYLPNLTALWVSGLSFFDHAALMELRGAAAPRAGLRLLCADREVNATSAGLVEGLGGHFTKLVYLDLSYTASARDPGVLKALGKLGDLLVLKMRGVRMRDEGVEVLTGSIGVKVRVLDLRDNLVTDAGVRMLIEGSFLTPQEGSVSAGGSTSLGSEGFLGAEGLRSEDLEANIVDLLRLPNEQQPAFEYLPHSGITHLFISGNRLTGEGVAALLASKVLCVLDVGAVDVDESVAGNSEPLSADVSAARRLVPILVTTAAKSLTYLRVTHSVVTERAPIMDVSSSTDLLGERLASTQISGQPEPEPYPGTPKQGQLSLKDSRESRIKQLLAKRPDTFTVFQRPTGDRYLHLHPSHLSNVTTLVLTDIPSSVPTSSNIISSLTCFITSCADESLLATLQSQSNYSLPPGRFRASAERKHARSLFPLRRIILEITPATASGPEQGRKQSKVIPGGWNSEYYHNPAFPKSSTGDQDGERLWAAAANDFSFFGGGEDEDEDEEEAFRRKKAMHLEAERGPRVDVVSALAQFRREKRREFERLVGEKGSAAGLPVAVEGHWEGEVKIVRNV